MAYEVQKEETATSPAAVLEGSKAGREQLCGTSRIGLQECLRDAEPNGAAP
jgi:hypothetical protein